MTTSDDDTDDEPDFDRVGFRRGGKLEGLAAYEDSAVKYLCTRLGMVHVSNSVAAEARERGAAGRNFPLFDSLAYFPVRLRVGRLTKVRFVTLPDLFNRFARTPIGVALEQVCDDVDPAHGPMGLVFRWAGLVDDQGRQQTIKGGRFMVAHTAGSTTEGTVKLSASLKLRGRRCDVTVETFDSFLENYRGWSPYGQ